ncbi:phage portal, HK97 family domain protein, partial [Escherichia coli EC4196]
MDSSRSVIFAV